MVNIFNQLNVILFFRHVMYPFIITLIFHYFYFFILINLMQIIYLLMPVFLAMFIDAVIRFCLLILNDVKCPFLMHLIRYVTNIFSDAGHIILFLFGLVY
jgi:hypothetical protein